MKSAFIFFASALTSSCVHSNLRPVIKMSDMVPASTYIAAHCSIYDLQAEVVRNFQGRNCIFDSDGATYAETNNEITKFDSRSKRIWVTPMTISHHTFHKSAFGDELLALESEFQYKKDRNLRSDILKVLNLDGKVIKTAKFNTFLAHLKKKGFKQIPAAQTPWLDAFVPNVNPNFDISHVNSFYEYYEEKDGKRFHSGYVVHCNIQKLILVLSKDLKTVLKTVHTGARDIHDVQQINGHQFIFYQNQDLASADGKNSLIAGFDLKTNDFFKIYQPEPTMSSSRCGSVKLTADQKIFITHSNCDPVKRKQKTPAMVELYDPSKKISALLPFHFTRVIAESRLLNLAEYLKNNTGM